MLSPTHRAPGTILYIWARREQGKQVFTPIDWIIFFVAVIGAIYGIYGLATGAITV